MREFAKYENGLRQSGIEIVALAVDGVGGEEQIGPSLAEEKIRTLKFPFISGKASPELVDKLMLVVSQLFSMDLPPVVPMSFLLDRQGYLAALYQGPVEVSELQEDVKRLAVSGNALRDLATPFRGAWMLNHQARIPLVQISLVMQEAGYREDSVAYFDKHVDSQKGEPEYPSLLVKIGASLHQMGKYSAAENRFREAIGVDPQLFEGHLKLGITLGIQQKLDQSAAALRRAIELSPDEPRAHCYLGTALQGLGKQQEALQSFQKGLDLVPAGVDVDQNVATAINRAKYVLGLARLQEGEVRLGLELLRAAAQWNDQYLFAINNHAWYLACHSDSGQRNPELGVLLAKLAAELTDFKHSAVLDTLSVAEAAVGDFENAVSTATRAMELTKGKQDTADAIQGRLELFKQSRPYIQQLQ
ncbi:MAG TPA: tetratricopeptide repeat protein [Nitrospirales bacterium]|nr:tetratricopeptide repeat protein [Nitrospirales bacterium]